MMKKFLVLFVFSLSCLAIVDDEPKLDTDSQLEIRAKQLEKANTILVYQQKQIQMLQLQFELKSLEASINQMNNQLTKMIDNSYEKHKINKEKWDLSLDSLKFKKK